MSDTRAGVDPGNLPPPTSDGRKADPLVRILEAGLVATVILGPLPFGAVVPAGRLGLELGAFLLGVLWMARAMVRSSPLPPRAATLGMAGLLLLGLLQIVPLGEEVTSRLSPRSLEIRRSSLPSGQDLEIERRLTGFDPSLLDPRPTLSVAPDATASALRTGAALAILLLVATTVAATRGPRALALGLLASAAFQALYGVLVLASGHDMIWHLPKQHFLDSATGSFVNRNHFAGFVAAALPCGLGLALGVSHPKRRREGIRWRVLEIFSTEGSRTLLLGLLIVLGLAGLLLSLSRAGIALGLGSLLLTAMAAGRRGLNIRLVVILLVLAAAALPLFQLGADRLAHRYLESSENLAGARPVAWRNTLAMATEFPAVGAGFGTFRDLYPSFRSPEIRFRFDHAHNDMIQALAEGGLPALLFLGMILWSVLRRVVHALSGGGGALAIGLASGLGTILLHSLVDFPFHIPSNAAVGVILAGALLGLPWNDRS